jgi:hypothetical protein
MAFIDKKDPVVLNIKLTSKGRELLSEGNLNFKYFAIGDSEMDYALNSEINAQLLPIGQTFDPFNSHILRPFDKNPSLLSFIPRNLSGDPYNLISNVPSTPTIIQNTAQPLGFFIINSGATTFITDTDHVKQPDAMVKIDNVAGGYNLELFKAPTYLANPNEPSIGDYLLVKWTNPLGINTTGYTVNKSYPTPYLTYKITTITGTLLGNNLIVGVDRELPDFSNILGTSGIVAGAVIIYNYDAYSGTSAIYSTDYMDDAVLAFLENCQCPTITTPFWNMTIIFTENIAGVQTTDRNFGQYKSKSYGGFVSYIQNQASVYRKLGVIHYTNSSPSNIYAEELYQNTPTMELPTIMWHKSIGKTLGAKFKAFGGVKMLTGITRSLNTNYYDLADLDGNIVGKVFNDLKIFVIEDQELLFAMSYKSNRSWTLPNYNVGINDNVVIGCVPCSLEFQITIIPPTTIGGSDGSIYVHDILNSTGKLILEISGITGNLFYETIIGNTIVNNLALGNYNVTLYDLGSPNCAPSSGVTVINPTSKLKLYNVNATASGLNIKLTQLSATSVRINQTDIGSVYGTPTALIKPYGQLPTLSDTWVSFVSSQVNFDSMTFRYPYIIYVRDTVNPTTGFTASTYYVAAGNPLNISFATSQGSNTGGTYINVSDYLTTITPSLNPIVGDIEISIYSTGSVPTHWVAGDAIETPVKLYPTGVLNYTTNYYTVAVREIYDNNIVMYTFTKTITLTT